METRRGALSESDLEVAERACELLIAIDDRLKAIAHSRESWIELIFLTPLYWPKLRFAEFSSKGWLPNTGLQPKAAIAITSRRG